MSPDRHLVYPNLYIVGAERAGTTTLYRTLSRGTGAYFPEKKEPNYWATSVPSRAVFTDEDYKRLYSHAPPAATLLGDASPSYLYMPDLPHRILKVAPNALFVIVLRNPVDRAYSHYTLHRVRYGTERRPFLDCLDPHDPGPRGFHGLPENPYVFPSIYTPHVRRYVDSVPRNRIWIGLYEEMFGPSPKAVEDLFQFLGLDLVGGLGGRSNSSELETLPGVRRLIGSRFAERLRHAAGPGIKRIAKLLTQRQRPSQRPLSEFARSEAWKNFDRDVTELELLLGRSLEIWRNPRPAGTT